MTIADLIDRGSVTFMKNEDLYSIVYYIYDKDGNSTTQKFEARNIQLAFMKLEEYLKYSS